MKRINSIRARIVNISGKETGIGGSMRIPGMKIGTQMAPGAPNYEDIMWMADSLEKVAEFLKSAEYVAVEDAHVAKKLAEDIEEGR